MTSTAADTSQTSGRTWLLVSALAVAVLAALPFLPALHNDFVSWDDNKNFIQNPFYRGLGLTQLEWMWTTFHMGHYVPLSWMTLGLDYVLWGMNPTGYHLTNILLHAANAAVLFLVARRLLSLVLREGRRSAVVAWSAAFAALVFAVHPLRVESVAWATERRDVLSGLLYSLTVLAYLRAVEQSPMTSRSYAPVFALFFAALLSKATAMTLPAVLLLLNVYPLRRVTLATWRTSARLLFKELAPLALLSIAAMRASLLALRPGPQLSILDKAGVSAYSVAFYLWKTLAPLNLSPIYPMPETVPLTSATYVASYLTVAAILLFIVIEWRRRTGAAAALLGFIVIVLPMLGIVQNGPQVAADRYTYHPAAALALLAGAGFAAAWRRRQALTVVGGVLLLGTWGAMTARQTRYWHDSESLWRHAVAVVDYSAVAHDGLGTVLLRKDSVQAAMLQYQRAADLSPNYADAEANLAIALAYLGRNDDATKHFERALELKPDFDYAEMNWGVVLAIQGKYTEAIGHYRLALFINSENGDAELNLANALVASGDLKASIPHYERAAVLLPPSAEIEARWGAALAQMGQLNDAIPHFRRAAQLDPGDARSAKLLVRALSESAGASPKRAQ